MPDNHRTEAPSPKPGIDRFNMEASAEIGFDAREAAGKSAQGQEDYTHIGGFTSHKIAEIFQNVLK